MGTAHRRAAELEPPRVRRRGRQGARAPRLHRRPREARHHRLHLPGLLHDPARLLRHRGGAGPPARARQVFRAARGPEQLGAAGRGADRPRRRGQRRGAQGRRRRRGAHPGRRRRLRPNHARESEGHPRTVRGRPSRRGRLRPRRLPGELAELELSPAARPAHRPRRVAGQLPREPGGGTPLGDVPGPPVGDLRPLHGPGVRLVRAELHRRRRVQRRRTGRAAAARPGLPRSRRLPRLDPHQRQGKAEYGAGNHLHLRARNRRPLVAPLHGRAAGQPGQPRSRHPFRRGGRQLRLPARLDLPAGWFDRGQGRRHRHPRGQGDEHAVGDPASARGGSHRRNRRGRRPRRNAGRRPRTLPGPERARREPRPLLQLSPGPRRRRHGQPFRRRPAGHPGVARRPSQAQPLGPGVSPRADRKGRPARHRPGAARTVENPQLEPDERGRLSDELPTHAGPQRAPPVHRRRLLAAPGRLHREPPLGYSLRSG